MDALAIPFDDRHGVMQAAFDRLLMQGNRLGDDLFLIVDAGIGWAA